MREGRISLHNTIGRSRFAALAFWLSAAVGSSVHAQESMLSRAGLENIFGKCTPPSTQETILVVVGTMVFLAVSYLLLVRLIERRYIQQDRSPRLGRNWGYSLTIFLTIVAFVILVRTITGCVHETYWMWIGFALFAWVVHSVYTLVVVRGD